VAVRPRRAHRKLCSRTIIDEFGAPMTVGKGVVQISVWDTEPTLPAACPADPGRVRQHGLEIIMAVCQSFEVRREPVGKQVRAAVVPADDPAEIQPAACCDRPWAPEPGAGACGPLQVVGGPLGGWESAVEPGSNPGQHSFGCNCGRTPGTGHGENLS